MTRLKTRARERTMATLAAHIYQQRPMIAWV
jgi:hypothetical protein